MKVNCWYCKDSFTPQARDVELVIAWVNTMRRRGGNAPITRHSFGVWAHGDCARLPNQDSFNLEVPLPEDIL